MLDNSVPVIFSVIEQSVKGDLLGLNMQTFGESHLIPSGASTREKEQRQRRFQARRETFRTRLAREAPSQMQIQVRV